MEVMAKRRAGREGERWVKDSPARDGAFGKLGSEMGDTETRRHPRDSAIVRERMDTLRRVRQSLTWRAEQNRSDVLALGVAAVICIRTWSSSRLVTSSPTRRMNALDNIRAWLRFCRSWEFVEFVSPLTCLLKRAEFRLVIRQPPDRRRRRFTGAKGPGRWRSRCRRLRGR